MSKQPPRSDLNHLITAGLAAALVVFLPFSAEATPETAKPASLTEHFAFYSDFETNLNDALLAAADARLRSRNELFREGDEAACFDALTNAERVAWDRAVDYYAKVVFAGRADRGAQFLVRLSLAGVVADDEWEKPAERRMIEITRAFRSAAAPTYRACRWSAQNAANRRWIEQLQPLLTAHETAIAGRLAEVFQTDWQSLPFRVDVVEIVEWSGANTIQLRPPGAHILISSSRSDYQGEAALEMIFHEASHFLTGWSAPLRDALNQALEELGDPFGGSLLHAVHFYLTGEVVRRRLERSDETAYEPYLFANDIFDQNGFHSAVKRIFPRYLAGDLDLSVASRNLVQALLDEKRRTQ